MARSIERDLVVTLPGPFDARAETYFAAQTRVSGMFRVSIQTGRQITGASTVNLTANVYCQRCHLHG